MTVSAASLRRPDFVAIPDSVLKRKALRSAAPLGAISYEFTQDPGLLHQYFLMREAMFVSVWGLKQFSGDQDHFDDVSHVMVARRGLQVLAGGRLTISTSAKPQLMPMEGGDMRLKDMFSDLALEGRTFCEFSRLAILPEFRAGPLFPELAQRFIRRAVAEGVDYAFNMAPVPLARSYRQSMMSFGLNWEIRPDLQVPDREEFEGIKMVLSVMDLRHLRGAKMPSSQSVIIEPIAG